MHEPSPLRSLPANRRDRWMLLDSLIACWHNSLDEPAGYTLDELRAAEASMGSAIPSALAEWYRSSGKRRSVWSRQDEFLAPEKLYMENDALIFYVENQSVVKWGIPTDKLAVEDPPVVVESVDHADEWIMQTDNLSKFAIYMFAYTLAFADNNAWIYGYAKPPLIQSISNRFPLFDFPKTWWTQTRLFGYDDLIIAIDGGDFVHACALSDTSLASFTNLASAETFDVYASSDG